MAKGRVVVDRERCKGCELCLSACPQDVLQMDLDHLNGKGYYPAMLVDPESKCTGCALCAVACPDVCLTVYRTVVSRRSSVISYQSSVISGPVTGH